MTRFSWFAFLIALALPLSLLADDASKAAQQSMHRFVAGQMVNGTYYFYDPFERKLLALCFNKIHEDVRSEGTSMVSCSHFTDQFGRSVDLDFLVLPKNSGFVTTQAIVHEVDGRARPYDLKLKTQTK